MLRTRRSEVIFRTIKLLEHTCLCLIAFDSQQIFHKGCSFVNFLNFRHHVIIYCTMQWELLKKLENIIYKKYPLSKEQGIVSNFD